METGIETRAHNTNQPNTKSNPNPNTTTKQHEIQLNTVAFPTYWEIRDHMHKRQC